MPTAAKLGTFHLPPPRTVRVLFRKLLNLVTQALRFMLCCSFMPAAAKLGAFDPSPSRAIRAFYDRRRRRIFIRFSTGLDVSFSPRDAKWLEKATPAQLAEIEISPSGYGIHFPKIDADFYLPALLLGFLGSRNWIAGRLGAVGGKSRSAAKIAAAKRNGRRGGRPKKSAAVA
jgi:hypothetical protein